ncbi:DUF2971 domain-containing protein [Methanosarcina sp. DH1]|uniref:DUF2971 domain-containing protein n=1 Tax=Methanosarcina sp. DH1 TaxID=2605695 RepID=UPI001E2D170A|nr:DUF2971 domain-containing protein [Methanosarcina sp. DH1]MCC4767482.1 DUF2971 domain-containing protein [Methanosarcina sp. DH1]
MDDEKIDKEPLFYKYHRISTNFLNNLSNNQLFFRDPTEFNDPFDCKITLCKKGTKKEWIAYHVKYGWKKENVERKVEDDLKNGKSTRQGEKIVSYSDIDSSILPRVCCFSTRNDSILMWSHYADSHRGVCLCFKTKKSLVFDSRSGKLNDMYRLTLDSSDLNSNINELREVEYKAECPDEVNTLNLNETEVGNQVWECFTTKYCDWKYEKEYRMLVFKKYFHGEYVKKYEKNKLEGIIFGLKIKRSDAQEVYNRVCEHYINKGEKVSFYKALYVKDKYALEIKKIEKEGINCYLESLPVN